MTPHIIIPARYDSSRFPGKPLVPLDGRASVLRTLDAARAVVLPEHIYVATDDERIAQAVRADGGQVLMTAHDARNGTERVAQAAALLGLGPDALVINLQGDAPLTPSWFIQSLIDTALFNPDLVMVTPVLRCDRESYLRFSEDRAQGRVGATTAVLSASSRAIYFSKQVIPYLASPDDLAQVAVFHHVGLYAYRVSALERYLAWGEAGLGPLERAEGLEQLRFIENDCDVSAVVVEDRGHQFWELNNPADVAVIERMMAQNAALASA